MTAGAALLLACIVVAAAWAIAHAVLVVACLRGEGLTATRKWLSLVPPVTPWVAWHVGQRRTVALWACLIVLYAALRMALAAR